MVRDDTTLPASPHQLKLCLPTNTPTCLWLHFKVMLVPENEKNRVSLVNTSDSVERHSIKERVVRRSARNLELCPCDIKISRALHFNSVRRAIDLCFKVASIARKTKRACCILSAKVELHQFNSTIADRRAFHCRRVKGI